MTVGNAVQNVGATGSGFRVLGFRVWGLGLGFRIPLVSLTSTSSFLLFLHCEYVCYDFLGD